MTSSERQTSTAVGVYDGSDRRIDERADTEQLILVKSKSGEVAGELLDISASGARLRIREGFCPQVGADVRIVLLDRSELVGTVTRIDGSSLGMVFDIKLLQPSDYLHHDHLGFDFYRVIQRLQSQRVRGG